MKTLVLAGALVFSFVLGGITTLLGFPRHHFAASTIHSAATISPEDLTRSAGTLPVQVLENYF
jgi:hypothetical protein